MRRGAVLVAVLVSTAACRPEPLPTLPPPAKPRTDELGPGDIIEIRVAEQDELTGEYEIGEDGTIRFPWIGELEVAGRSKAEISAALEQRLTDGWLRQPQVVVRVLTRQNREVSVLGQVNQPGSYPYKERLTLVQAISLAGGMNPLSQPKRVKLIRETDQGRQTFEINVREIINSKRDDLPLEPGDIVFVPEAPI